MSTEQFPPADPTWRPDPPGYLGHFPDMSVVWGADVRDCIDEIEDIHVNPMAAGILPRSHRYLASEDFLLDHAVLSALPQNSTATYISHPNWTRALVSGQVNVPYNNQFGRYIMSKGNSSTGKEYGGVPYTTYKEPRGFFGAKDAAKELVVGNQLLEAHFRASLPLGYIVLDQDKLHNQIGRLWAEEPELRKNIQHQLAIVETNGDLPAILVRLTGSRNRLDDYMYEFNFQEMIAGLSTLPKFPQDVITTLCEGKLVSEDDMNRIAQSFNILLEGNVSALWKVMPTLRNHSSFPNLLTYPKDLDATYSVQDYEEAIEKMGETSITDKKVIHNYFILMREVIKNELCNLFAYKGYYQHNINNLALQLLKDLITS